MTTWKGVLLLNHQKASKLCLLQLGPPCKDLPWASNSALSYRASVDETLPHYISCLKPNNLLIPDGAWDCLQHNHNNEFSYTLLNQLFQEWQPSNFQCNIIPPLAIIIFATNWSVGYWWRQSGYWKKSTFQLFPSIIKKVQPWIFRHTMKSIISRTTAIQFPTQPYPPTRHIFCN